MKNENSRIGKVFVENKLKLELLESSDLVLINRVFAFDDVLALPPNVVSVGSLHAQRINEIPNDVSLNDDEAFVSKASSNTDSISCDDFSHSQDVFTFAEASDKPIILFTMGSNILAEDLGRDRLSIILAAFRELNEFNFICKCSAKFNRRNPQNVLFVDWLQQNELLGKDISLVTHQLTKR